MIMDNLLIQIHNECKSSYVNGFTNIKVKIDTVYIGHTIGLTIKNNSNVKILDSFRNKIIDICERDDKMSRYHITLAYKYNDIPKEEKNAVQHEINTLRDILEKQIVTLHTPVVCSFSDMTEFKPVAYFQND